MRGSPTRVVVAVGLFVAIVLIGVLSVFASDRPDALERVASDNRIGERGRSAPGFLPEDDRAAGLVGAAVVLVLVSGAAYVLRRRTPR